MKCRKSISNVLRKRKNERGKNSSQVAILLVKKIWTKKPIRIECINKWHQRSICDTVSEKSIRSMICNIVYFSDWNKTDWTYFKRKTNMVLLPNYIYVVLTNSLPLKVFGIKSSTVLKHNVPGRRGRIRLAQHPAIPAFISTYIRTFFSHKNLFNPRQIYWK